MLKQVSTATLCTCLFKRGLRQQFIQNVQPIGRYAENMVGPAFTLRYIPAREDINGMEVFLDHGHPQRKAVEEFPPGAVLVFDSRKDARAASAGGVARVRRRSRSGIRYEWSRCLQPADSAPRGGSGDSSRASRGRSRL